MKVVFGVGVVNVVVIRLGFGVVVLGVIGLNNIFNILDIQNFVNLVCVYYYRGIFF